MLGVIIICILQQDNDPKHSSNCGRDGPANLKCERTVCLLEKAQRMLKFFLKNSGNEAVNLFRGDEGK